MRLHLGCGPKVVGGWENIDGSWSAWFANHSSLLRGLARLNIVPKRLAQNPYPPGIRIHDLRQPLRFAKTSSCDAVYASHLLEHLRYDYAQNLLRETYRVLGPGGAARFVVPDLMAVVLEYLGEASIADQSGDVPQLQGADRFSARFLNVGIRPESSSLLYRVYSAYSALHDHKWMYDGVSLSHHMQQAGFEGVRERALHDSCISGISDVEDPDRILNGNGVCVEGYKPKG